MVDIISHIGSSTWSIKRIRERREDAYIMTDEDPRIVITVTKTLNGRRLRINKEIPVEMWGNASFIAALVRDALSEINDIKY